MKHFKFNKDDLSFWRNQTKDLKNKAKLEIHKNISNEVESEAEDFLNLKLSKEEILRFRGDVKEDLIALPDLVLGEKSAGIDKNTNKKFTSGKMPIEARLDMHGMTQEQALKELISFISRSYSTGKRCVVVITGKGTFGKSKAVLKKSFPKWINYPDIRPKILSFSPAIKKDGGSGAFYVFLKRKR
ncbi:MAG: Smr/MutS family protein [Alphaproteobacteria bacterium]|jgi:DNA-nicking Smr family endonuclease|nr:Smr/MutS family protein [Alphaproteobacteria bacterium]